MFIFYVNFYSRDALFIPNSLPVKGKAAFQSIPNESTVTIILGGDVMLGRSVEIQTRKQGDYRYPFLKIEEVLETADIAFVNLENPIIENCPPHNSGFTFCANPNMLEGLTYAGIDIVTLANNHTLNYGNKGLEETTSHLQKRGIAYTGLENLATIEKNGTTFGFIGLDKAQLGNPVLTEAERKLIEESDTKVDVLIVAPHWGVEYKETALPGVRTFAHELVNLGADVIVGAHPHWVQDREYIDERGNVIVKRRDEATDVIEKYTPIYYSLGNFIFDQMWSEETKKGLLVKLVFKNGEIIKESLYNTYMPVIGQSILSSEL